MIKAFLNEIQQTNIITVTTVNELRDFIRAKYADKSSEYKAKLFAGSIHSLLDKALDGLSLSIKKTLKTYLIKEKLVKTFTELSLYDILCTYTKFIRQKNDTADDVSIWLERQTGCNTKKLNIKKIIRTLKKEDRTEDMRQNTKDNNRRAYNIYLKRFSALALSGIILVLTLASSSKNYNTIKNQFRGEVSVSADTNRLKKEVALHTGDRYREIKTMNVSSAYIEKLEHLPKNKEILTSYLKNEHLPKQLRYQDVDIKELRAFLKSRKSILSNEPYFSTIITTALEYDLNPMLLFAIAGQEQSLVPETGKNAEKIANNPFNVHYSWIRYNTNIVDSTQIAANTIIKLAKGCPEDVDPIKWINRLYAEDQEWWKGVHGYLRLMDKATG
jgi:putative ABC transport system permease protein